MDIPYQIIRSNRKTLALEITHDGRVIVRSPMRLSQQEILIFLMAKEDWILSHLKKHENRPQVQHMTKTQLRTLASEALDWFPDRVRNLADRVGVTYGGITIRAQRTRWGSCSSLGNLNFNCLLMLAPEDVRDYVIVHELCHRKEMNHSPRFWAEVERVLPGYRDQLRWLKENGADLMARLPD